MDLQYLECCGLGEISGISYGRSAKNKLLELIREVGGISGLRSGLFFTGAARYKNRPPAYASQFKTYIEEHNLGDVQVLPAFINKNTQRFITTYLWVVNVQNLTAWYRQNENDAYYCDGNDADDI